MKKKAQVGSTILTLFIVVILIVGFVSFLTKGFGLWGEDQGRLSTACESVKNTIAGASYQSFCLRYKAHEECQLDETVNQYRCVESSQCPIATHKESTNEKEIASCQQFNMKTDLETGEQINFVSTCCLPTKTITDTSVLG